MRRHTLRSNGKDISNLVEKKQKTENNDNASLDIANLLVKKIKTEYNKGEAQIIDSSNIKLKSMNTLNKQNPLL